jgi:hypothetical protein
VGVGNGEWGSYYIRVDPGLLMDRNAYSEKAKTKKYLWNELVESICGMKRLINR